MKDNLKNLETEKNSEIRYWREDLKNKGLEISQKVEQKGVAM